MKEVLDNGVFQLQLQSICEERSLADNATEQNFASYPFKFCAI